MGREEEDARVSGLLTGAMALLSRHVAGCWGAGWLWGLEERSAGPVDLEELPRRGLAQLKAARGY